MYNKILIAFDLLDKDKCPILKKALKLKEGELHLIHVVEPFYTYGTPPYAFNIQEMQEQLVKSAEEKLSSIAEDLKVPSERQYVPIGSAKERILEYAKKLKCDLIILGSHSTGGISEFLLGSTANGVLNGARCDVLAVRSGAKN